MVRLILGIAFMLAFAPPGQAESIVVVGDSHMCVDSAGRGVSPYGSAMLDKLSDGGKNKVKVFCAGGTSVAHWKDGTSSPASANRCWTYGEDRNPHLCGSNGSIPSIENILRTEKPDRVIPILGSNNLGGNLTKEAFEKFAHAIKAAGTKCSWIGPPTFCPTWTYGGKSYDTKKQNDDVVKTIKSAIGAGDKKGDASKGGEICSFVDSREKTTAADHPANDCIHMSAQGAKNWAEGTALAALEGASSGGAAAKASSNDENEAAR